MKVACDPEVDAIYIRPSDDPAEVTTRRLGETVAVNYAPDGRMWALRCWMLPNMHVSGLRTERKIALENLVPV